MAAENWFWLASGLGYGAVNSGELLRAFPGGAAEIEDSLGSDLLDTVLTQKQAERLASSRPADFMLRINHYETTGVTTLGYDDPRYPDALRRTTNPPPVLFVKGDTALLNGQLAVAMVGARRPSAYGVEAAKALGRGIALGGAIIVSGLAAGLDTEAHKAALAVNGPTIACIAFGHDQCYPAANRKLMEVIERNGAVVSEYPLGTTPEKPFFLHRNRIIAGLAHGLVVLEARRYSGTMSTVNFAIDYGRDVFAVPGSIFSELSGGTNAMIRDGAYLAANAADVLSVYGVEAEAEDPGATLARKTFEDRPAPADAQPPWKQNLARTVARAIEEQPEPRREAPATRPAADRGENAPAFTTAQAMEAFRMLQQNMPPTEDSELDARNAALDAMVEAVSDSVEIGGKSAPAGKGAGRGQSASSNIQPFRWDRLERLEKDKIEDLSPAKEDTAPTMPGKKPSLASRLLGSRGTKEKSPPDEAPLMQQILSSEPIGAVEPVGRVGAVGAVAPVAPVQSVRNTNKVGAAAAPAPAKAPAAERPKPAEKPRPARAPAGPPLAGRLSTLQETAQKQTPAAKPAARNADGFSRTGPVTPAATPATAARPEGGDGTELLSEVAKRAYRQLGPKPTTLAAICEKSGLSSAEAMAALTELELAGLSRQLAGRQFVISNV